MYFRAVSMARHDKMVEFAQTTMSYERGAMSAGRDSERLTASGAGRVSSEWSVAKRKERFS